MAELSDLVIRIKATPVSGWWQILKEAVFQTKGEGVSSTKVAYLLSASTIGICVALMAVDFCWVYFKHHIADGTFAMAMGGMTTALIGFSSRSQNVKTKTQGGTNGTPQSPAPTDPVQDK